MKTVEEKTVQYGRSFYRANTLQYWAKKFLAVLPPTVNNLFSGGSSGCTIASGMLALSERQLEHTFLYPINGGETISHRGLDRFCSGPHPFDDEDLGEIAIVDDLIDSGKSVCSLLSIINSRITRVEKVKVYILVSVIFQTRQELLNKIATLNLDSLDVEFIEIRF
jgi:hypothetical protein